MTDWKSQPRTVIEALMRDGGIRYEDAETQFDEVAQRLGVDATMSARHLRRLASGERKGTRADTQRVLEEMFQRRMAELIQPWSPPKSIEVVTPEFVTIQSGSADRSSEELLEMTVRRARQFTLDTSNYVASEVIEQISDDLREISTSYQQRPLSAILGDLVETQDTVFTLLDHRHRSAELSQLYVVAGVVSGVLAKASHDMGDAHSAQTHARTGFMCAEHAEHDGLRAWLKGLQSFVAYWSRRPHDSLRYATDGARYAARAGNTTQIWIAANEARAWAALGNSSEALAAIDRSEAAAESVQVDEIDLFGGICTFGRSRQLYYAADALSQLPDAVEKTERYSQSALEAYSDTSAPDWSFSDQAGSSAGLAIARIRAGEVEGAVEALEPVLELDASRRIHGIVSSADRVHAALSQAEASSAASDLQMEIEAFTRTPLKAVTP